MCVECGLICVFWLLGRLVVVPFLDKKISRKCIELIVWCCAYVDVCRVLCVNLGEGVGAVDQNLPHLFRATHTGKRYVFFFQRRAFYAPDTIRDTFEIN